MNVAATSTTNPCIYTALKTGTMACARKESGENENAKPGSSIPSYGFKKVRLVDDMKKELRHHRR